MLKDSDSAESKGTVCSCHRGRQIN